MRKRSWRGLGVVTGVGLAMLASLGCISCSGPSSERTADAVSSGKLPPQVLDTSDVREEVPVLSGAGARCRGGICACRDVDKFGRGTSPDTDIEAAAPAEGFKRFELRTGRGNDAMRITIEGVGTFLKTGPLPEAACVYVDLPAGAYRVRYHVTAANPMLGSEPRLRISEYSPRWKRWYRTFAFRCADGEQACTKNMAQDMFEQLSKQTDGKFDPCGSTRVQGLRFWTDREPDQAVGEFNLQLVLNIYKFAPRFPPDTARCKGASYDARPDHAPSAEGDGFSVQQAPSSGAPAAPPQ